MKRLPLLLGCLCGAAHVALSLLEYHLETWLLEAAMTLAEKLLEKTRWLLKK